MSKLFKKIPLSVKLVVIFIIISLSLFLLVKYKYWKSDPKENYIEEVIEERIAIKPEILSDEEPPIENERNRKIYLI